MGALNNILPTERRGYTDIGTAPQLGVSVATVRRWRLSGDGPVYRKFDGCVRYFDSDSEAVIHSAQKGRGEPVEDGSTASRSGRAR